MLYPLALFAAAALLLGGQSADDPDTVARARLAKGAEQVTADLRDPALMADSRRATMVRLTIESNWRLCAAIEAGAIARQSERPARIVAENALMACRLWEEALRLALDSGADPYVNGQVSREDMIARTGLEARDAAMARILRWRGAAGDVRAAAIPTPPRQNGPIQPRPIPRQVQPQPQQQEAPLADGEEPSIVVVGKIDRRCRVRFSDRTLTEAQLARKALEWAASGATLRLIRPPGADYRCLSRIVWHLGKYGMRKFVFVEPSDTAPEPTER